MSPSSAVRIVVSRDGLRRFEGVVPPEGDFRPIELGRADPADSNDLAFALQDRVERIRLPIAEPGETDVSRRQALLERIDGGGLRLTNLSRSITLECHDRPSISPGHSAEYPLPVEIRLGRLVVVVESYDAGSSHDEDVLRTLDTTPVWNEGVSIFQSHSLQAAITELSPSAVDSLVAWWRNVIGVLQSATHSEDFFQKATQAVVRLVGLDLGAVYLREENTWRPAAIETRGTSSARPSSSVLGRVLTERRTVFNRVEESFDVFSSMAALDAFVVSPILDREGRVLGALYGHRSRDVSRANEAGISHLEALLVETLACGVAAGLARLEKERESTARQLRFEQFFSPQLAAELEANPNLLAGRDAEVTVLFCDLREFSSASERLGPQQTMDWIRDVLGTLSDEVANSGGVLVDYIGDAVMAMWGAPAVQPDHASLACRAAVGMLARASEIDSRWQGLIGQPTRFGIGVNTTIARVGNTGSHRKFKYGPLGNGVNLASRVEGATKYLRVPAIVTGATQAGLGGCLPTRRLCTVRVVNIAEPVELYELGSGDDPSRTSLFKRYEEALEAFEQARYTIAAQQLGEILAETPGDGPSLVLLSRAVDCMIREPVDFSPVWELPGK